MKVRAAVLEEAGAPLVMKDVSLARPEGREVLVEVRASGICHSDMTAAGSDVGLPLPMVLGHEVAGAIIAVGPAVTTLEVGDHVVACGVDHCGTCADCVRGRPYRCQRPDEIMRRPDQEPRITVDGAPVTQFSFIGGFMERVVLHENSLVAIDKRLPFEKAAVLGCGVATGAGAAINTAGIRVGDVVVVVGCGGVGLNAVQGARLAGARSIIAVDIRAGKLDLAVAFGATATVDASREDAVAAVADLTGGIGADYVFECAGTMPTTRQSIEMTRPTGSTFLVGVQQPGNVLALRPFDELLLAKRSIRSVFMGSSNFKYDLPLYVDLYFQGRFNLDDLVSRTIALDEIQSGFDAIASGDSARTVITI